MAKSKPEIIDTLTGGILALTALLVAVGKFTDALKSLPSNLENIPPVLIYMVCFVVALIGVYIFHRGFSRKSRLLRPEMLLIDPDNPAHLMGRDDDIRGLKDQVLNHRLVFLEGESGSGKSALVRSGLLPALNRDLENQTILPIYINSYETSWSAGPIDQLVYGLWNALSKDERLQLGIVAKNDLRSALCPGMDQEPIAVAEKSNLTENCNDIFSRINDQLVKIPLLIFDQFDDYQAQHRGKFLRGGNWLTVKQLTINKSSRHPFWVLIRNALIRDKIHCLFVTRSDTFGGLESVRFVDPRVRYLVLLEPAYIIALLEKLVTPSDETKPVIANPQSGWEVLKDQLVTGL